MITKIIFSNAALYLNQTMLSLNVMALCTQPKISREAYEKLSLQMPIKKSIWSTCNGSRGDCFLNMLITE